MPNKGILRRIHITRSYNLSKLITIITRGIIKVSVAGRIKKPKADIFSNIRSKKLLRPVVKDSGKSGKSIKLKIVKKAD